MKGHASHGPSSWMRTSTAPLLVILVICLFFGYLWMGTWEHLEALAEKHHELHQSSGEQIQASAQQEEALKDVQKGLTKEIQSLQSALDALANNDDTSKAVERHVDSLRKDILAQTAKLEKAIEGIPEPVQPDELAAHLKRDISAVQKLISEAEKRILNATTECSKQRPTLDEHSVPLKTYEALVRNVTSTIRRLDFTEHDLVGCKLREKEKAEDYHKLEARLDAAEKATETQKKAYEKVKSEMIAIGKVDSFKDILRAFDGWKVAYEGYTAVKDHVTAMKEMKNLSSLRLLVFLGTWCGQSQQHVPEFVKEIEAVPDLRPPVYYALDRMKNGAPYFLERVHNVTNVPTIIALYDPVGSSSEPHDASVYWSKDFAAQNELGRLVEATSGEYVSWMTTNVAEALAKREQ